MNWKYKGTKQLIQVGDRVKVSKAWASKNSYASTNGTVTSLHGFITVTLDETGDAVDFDSRSVTYTL